MPVTRVFRSGSSQAVKIPAELAYDDIYLVQRIARNEDVIVSAQQRPSVAEMIAELRRLPKPDEVEAYEPTEVPDRE